MPISLVNFLDDKVCACTKTANGGEKHKVAHQTAQWELNRMGNKICLLMSLVASSLPLGAQSSNAPLLVLPEAKGHRLVLIDPRAKAVVGQIAVPGWPHEVAFSADGKLAYVPSYSDAIVGSPWLDGRTIDFVDMQSRSVVRTWDLGAPLRPHMPMLAKDGTLLVSTELAHSLSFVDLQNGKIVGQLPTGAHESHVFLKSPDGKTIYTANLHAGSISVLDVAMRRLVKVISISKLVNRIALSKDGKTLFASDGSSPNIIMIDTATNEIERRVSVAAPPFSVSVTSDGKWLLVGEDLPTKGRLEVIDLTDSTVTNSFEVGRMPFGIRVVDSEAFVACYLSGDVYVLDLATWKMEPPIANVAHGDGLALWGGVQGGNKP